MKFKTLAVVAALAAAVALGARGASAFLGGLVVNGSFAVPEVISIPLGQGVTNLSASVVYSSPAFSAATFQTGQVSTGSFAIANNAFLSTAAATESIVVTSTSGFYGDSVSLSCPVGAGAVVASNPRDWRYGATTAATATNLAAALTARRGTCLAGVQFIASGNVVYATAPVGGLYNSVAAAVTNSATMSIAHTTFTGGRDSAVLAINGTLFQANLNFTVGASSATTATNLASAINARAPINKWMTATAGSGASVGTVALQSKLASATYNFPLATSNSAALSVFGPRLVGGVNPSYAVGTAAIRVPAHGFVTGLPVLYSTGGAGGVIGGLTNQTTYYVGVIDSNDVGLATSRSNAQAGTYITLTSSQTLTAAVTDTLTPLAFATASQNGFAWVVSNDGVTWQNLNVSSLTYTSPGSDVWSFGALPFSYLGLSFTPPTSGAINLKVNAQGQ